MFRSNNTVGSVRWRVKNYGLFASANYLSQRIGNKHKRSEENFLSTVDFIDLAKILGISNYYKVINEISEMIANKAVELKANNKIDIKDVISDEAYSDTRLKVLSICILGRSPQTIFETGTQHGLSASIISKVINDYNIDSEFVSFDISEQYLLDNSVKKYRSILTTPVRKNFKYRTSKIAKGRVLFFHDSDHSYENMKFEFDWAWNNLKAEVLISDDIEGNTAFLDFCKKNDVKGIRLKFDKGPAVGLVLRGN
ncbi:MAG: hypothetical protein RL311_1263 [Bacteroidota bacterium]|jgi:hypothetical protein